MIMQPRYGYLVRVLNSRSARRCFLQPVHGHAVVGRNHLAGLKFSQARTQSADQSQRDCVLQPKVGAVVPRLPWVKCTNGKQPQRGCGHGAHNEKGRNHVVVEDVC